VGATLAEARTLARRQQARNSGAGVRWPLEIPPGDWAVRLATTFVEPAYLETDASWCEPGGEPVSCLANGGAFGGKMQSMVSAAARELADEHGRAVRVLLGREDVAQLGPKRPPIAAGLAPDGSGVVRVARTSGSGDLSEWLRAFAAAFAAPGPGCAVEVVDVPGPPVSAQVRGAGWVEAAVLSAASRAYRVADDMAAHGAADDMAAHGAADDMAADGCPQVPFDRTVSPKALTELASHGYEVSCASPEGGSATVRYEGDGVKVTVSAGEILDWTVLRSYCIGAVHQAVGWVRRESLSVDASGNVLDLTIRSFGILPARQTPPVEVEAEEGGGRAVNVSDAVFAATAALEWLHAGLPPAWPVEWVMARPAH